MELSSLLEYQVIGSVCSSAFHIVSVIWKYAFRLCPFTAGETTFEMHATSSNDNCSARVVVQLTLSLIDVCLTGVRNFSQTISQAQRERPFVQ